MLAKLRSYEASPSHSDLNEFAIPRSENFMITHYGETVTCCTEPPCLEETFLCFTKHFND
jgi:hypothetical protein